MIVERSAFGAFLVALYLFASSDTDVIAQKPGTLTAVGNERLFFTEFHFQRLSDKPGEFALDPLAILFAALYTDDKIICIADIFEFFIRLRRTGSFQELFAERFALSYHTLLFLPLFPVNVVAKIFDFVVQRTVFRGDLPFFWCLKFIL